MTNEQIGALMEEFKHCAVPAPRFQRYRPRLILVDTKFGPEVPVNIVKAQVRREQAEEDAHSFRFMRWL